MPKRSHFGLREKRDREKDREREREGKKSKPFSSDFTGFCRLELDRPRVKAALHDERAWVLESQDFTKVQCSSFHENREKGCVPGNHPN